MSKFKINDVVSVEFTVLSILANGKAVTIGNAYFQGDIDAEALTLVRRAPVDLATCEIGDGVEVRGDDGHGSTSVMVARHGEMAWLKWPRGEYTSAFVKHLRPLDAPAPDKSEVERMRLGLRNIGELCSKPDVFSDVKVEAIRTIANVSLASSAPTCPPGHIMIGDRAVLRGMTDAPTWRASYWTPNVIAPDYPKRGDWDGTMTERLWLQRGLIHSTESAARAHAEALIALSAGEGV